MHASLMSKSDVRMNAQMLSTREAREVFRHSHEFPHTREAGARAYFYL